ncbi:phosphoribosyltransferase-like protein, partial [Bacillus altitudinis]
MDETIKGYLTQVESEFGHEMYYKDIKLKHNHWIKNVNLKNDRDILNKLFYNLRFFSKLEIKGVLCEEIKRLKSLHNNLEQAAILPLSPVDGRYSGSNELISLIKEIDVEEQMNRGRLLPFRDSILNDLKYTKDIETLIFVDDIAGTGGTLEKFVKCHSKSLEGKKVIFIFLTATRAALDKFSAIQEKYKEIDFEFIHYHELKKVSSINILSKEEYKRLFDIEEDLWGKGNNNILGFKQSELLVLFSHNIPNNTISNFWHPSEEKWKRLFTRIT